MGRAVMARPLLKFLPMSVFEWILTVCYVLLLAVTLWLIFTDRSNSNPGKSLAWLALIVFLPVIGVVLYYIFGFDRRRIGDTEKTRLKFFEKVVPLLPHNVEAYIKEFDEHFNRIDHDYHRLVTLLAGNNHSRVLYGSRVEIITDGNRKLEMLIEDLENAKEHIHFEYFLFRRDDISRRIRDILMRKASEGVKVRFIYDNIANIDILPSYYNKMRRSGVEVNPFFKLSLSSIHRSLNNRNHRKLVVIDGLVGYVGGMNITSQTQRWRDVHLRLHGQGIYGLQMNFFQQWCDSGGELPLANFSDYFPEQEIFSQNLMQIAPEAPDTSFPYYALAVVSAIENAKRYIYIQTPYFLPTDPVMRALKTAALGGVEVRLMVSRKSDYAFMDWAIQAGFEEILAAGVHIHEIQNYFSHAKSMVIDDYLSVIGSSNLDYRSLELNFEINSFMYDPEVAARNRDIFLRDMNDCLEISPEEWARRPWWKKALQAIMRFFSPLL